MMPNVDQSDLGVVPALQENDTKIAIGGDRTRARHTPAKRMISQTLRLGIFGEPCDGVGDRLLFPTRQATE